MHVSVIAGWEGAAIARLVSRPERHSPARHTPPAQRSMQEAGAGAAAGGVRAACHLPDQPPQHLRR